MIKIKETIENGNKIKAINFQQEKTFGFKSRLIKIANADATIAIAYDFSTDSEKLTKTSVMSQNKKYIPLKVPKKSTKSDIEKADISTHVNLIVEQLNSVNAKTINITGNVIYTMKEAGWNQVEVDLMVYKILKGVIESSNLNNQITSIRTAGRSGFDEAGAKAGIKLGLRTIVFAPKSWGFGNVKGQKISNEEQYKNRFNQSNEDYCKTTSHPMNTIASIKI